MNAIAVFALVLLEALIAAVFSAALLEQRLSDGTRFSRQALDGAETELARALAAGQGSPGVRPLGDNFFLIDVSAADRTGQRRRRLGLLAELRPPAVVLNAAITTSGDVALADGARVLAGSDSCATDSGAPVAAVVDPLAGLDYDQFAAQASVRLAGGVYAPEPVVGWPDVCDTIVATNWGDGVATTMPCGTYRPVVHVAGDLEVSGGRGQGVLLVDGDLTVSGPFQFSGLIIVKGRIGTVTERVAGALLMGQVVVRNSEQSRQTLAGDLAVHLSKCHVINALASVARLEPLRSRAWIQLF